MTTSRFLTALAIVTAIAAAGVALLHWWLPIGYALPFSIFTALFFIGVSLLLFWLGRRSAGAENKHLFSNVFMGLTMVKMLFCVILIVAYALLGEPVSKLFIAPFFWLYLVYTGFEVWFMMGLSAVVSE